MSELTESFKNLNISQAKLKEIMESAKVNPMLALSEFQKLVPADKMQELMSMMMTNPNALKDLAASAGISQEDIDDVKDSLSS